MRAFLNDCVRQIIGWTIMLLGLPGNGWQRLRIVTYGANQRRLQRKYGIRANTRVRSYGGEVEHSIRNAARNHARFATTSGSTGKPKQIPSSVGESITHVRAVTTTTLQSAADR